MMKKGLLVLVIAVFFSGWSFAQTEFSSMPKNTVTVDVGPTLLGIGVGIAGSILQNMMGDDFDFNTSAFGIGAQYERQILESLGVAGRFAFLSLGAGLSPQEGSASANLDASVTSFSVEGHARFYPFTKRTFFVDGMLGYGNLAVNLDGYLDGGGRRETIKDGASRNYVKLGGKLGWRIDFGKPGGFVFEPSFGFYGAIGLGDTFGKQIEDIVDGDYSEIISQLDDIMGMIENFALIGGPRLSLAFGWRF